MASKRSKISADKEKHNNNQVINRNIAELWNSYKNFKAKFHAHNTKLEQFTLKVLKLSFFTNPDLKPSDNLKSKHPKRRNVNIKCQFALIKKAISIHLRSLQIEQRLFEENQFLKELLGSSYKIEIKEKNSAAVEIYEIKNVKAEEKCFKRGLEYIFHELEDVSKKTKLKIRNILDAGSDNKLIPQYVNASSETGILKCFQALPHENTKIIGVTTGKKLNVIPEVVDPAETDTEKSQNFNLQIDYSNLNSVVQNIANQSLNTLLLDVKPLHVQAMFDIKDTVDKRIIVEQSQVASAKVRSVENEIAVGIDKRKKNDIKSLKNLNAFMPNNIILNYIGLFFPLSILFQKAIVYHASVAQKKCDKMISQNETACVGLQKMNNTIKFEEGCGVTLENVNFTCSGAGGENVSNVSKDDHDLSEGKTVEFYDIPSNTDIHDYTVSWIEQQNERDFYYIKHPEKMENNTSIESKLTKHKSIMKRSVCSTQQDDFKNYLKNIITYSQEFLKKRGSNSTISPLRDRRRSRVINFPSSSSIESNYAEKYKTKKILEHNANYNNYKLPKMPNMNETYQIVLQQNMPQGFSLKFVKSREKDVSTLVVSNRYQPSKPIFPKTRFYKT